MENKQANSKTVISNSRKNKNNSTSPNSNQLHSKFTIEMDFSHNLKGGNQYTTHSNTRQDSVTIPAEIETENNDNNVLKYKPRDTIVNKQTNINVYFSPVEVKNEGLFINDIQSGKMTLTFQQKDSAQQTSKWKTKIGELFFQQDKI